MKTNKLIGIILIVAGIALGIMGVNKFENSGGSVDVLGAELSVQDNTSRSAAYMYLGLAFITLIGGSYVIRKP